MVGQADITRWNPPTQSVEPDQRLDARYDEGNRLYRELYESTKPTVHALARSWNDPA